jgi:hypothetical protein
MSDDRDTWFTAPLECSHCGSEGHSFRYCKVLEEERAEAAEMKADEQREEGGRLR